MLYKLGSRKWGEDDENPKNTLQPNSTIIAVKVRRSNY